MVIGWFARLFIVAAVVGVLGFDSINLVTAHTGAREDADNAATAAAAAWQGADGATNPAAGEAAATAAAATRLVSGESLVPGSLHVSASGRVTLEVRRTAEHTIVAHDIGPLRHLVTFTTAGTADAPTSS